MLVDPILVKFLIAEIAYGPLKYLKISGGLRLPSPSTGALVPAWGFAPVPKFELHIAISPGQVRCTSTFFAAMILGTQYLIRYTLYLIRYTLYLIPYTLYLRIILEMQLLIACYSYVGNYDRYDYIIHIAMP